MREGSRALLGAGVGLVPKPWGSTWHSQVTSSLLETENLRGRGIESFLEVLFKKHWLGFCFQPSRPGSLVMAIK